MTRCKKKKKERNSSDKYFYVSKFYHVIICFPATVLTEMSMRGDNAVALLTRPTELKALPAGQLLVQHASQYCWQQQDRPADWWEMRSNKGVGHEGYTAFGWWRRTFRGGKTEANVQCSLKTVNTAAPKLAVKTSISHLWWCCCSSRYLTRCRSCFLHPHWPTEGSFLGAPCSLSSLPFVHSGCFLVQPGMIVFP